LERQTTASSGNSRYFSFFNDKVTQIFQNKYLSPRPQATTLQLPWQGIGDWPHPHESFEVKDEGLRKLAQTNDQFELSQGIRFKTPSDPKATILFLPHNGIIILTKK
jgi:hypothetical protein